MANYQLFTDSSCDLSTDVRKNLNIDYLHFGIVLDGEEKPADLDWQAYSYDELYNWLKAGRKLKTTQVSYPEIMERCRPYLEKGMDIIYIGCSSALTGSVGFFNTVKQELLDEFPGRKIIGIDSLAASCTLGMLVVDAAKQRDAGLSIEELEKWVEDHKFRYNQWCTVETLKYLKEAGRVKAGAAFFGDIIGVKPIVISDRKGNNLAITKERGSKKALNAIFEGVKNTIHKDECDVVFVADGDNKDAADALEKRFVEELGVKVVREKIGPIVGITCGPGVIAAFCYGEEVTRFEGDGIK